MDAHADLDAMALFVEIVAQGSLSAAGRALGLPKATVSRRLAAMERRLGAPLLRRSTRALTLTDFGRRHHARIAPVVAEARAAQAEAMAQHATPAGLLRIGAPVAYGRKVLAPRLCCFLDAHPAVRLDLRLSDVRANLIADGFDLLVRMGALEDSDLVARSLGDVSMAVVAAPAWVAVHGTPATPAELASKPAVVTRPDLDLWTLGGTTVRVRWRVSTGDMSVTVDAARAGLGCALVPRFMVEDDLRAGRLRAILADRPPPSTRMTALHARSATASPAIRALLGHLAAGRGRTAAAHGSGNGRSKLGGTAVARR